MARVIVLVFPKLVWFCIYIYSFRKITLMISHSHYFATTLLSVERYVSKRRILVTFSNHSSGNLLSLIVLVQRQSTIDSPSSTTTICSTSIDSQSSTTSYSPTIDSPSSTVIVQVQMIVQVQLQLYVQLQLIVLVQLQAIVLQLIVQVQQW